MLSLFFFFFIKGALSRIEKVKDFVIFYKGIDIKSIIGCWREEKQI
jgi:hypothetical protein